LGANIKADNDYAITYYSSKKHFDAVKYLISLDANLSKINKYFINENDLAKIFYEDSKFELAYILQDNNIY